MMDRINTHNKKKGLPVVFCLVLFFLFLTAAAGFAGEREVRRAWVGLELFPTMLAADMDIASKQDPSGAIPVLLLYRDDASLALDMADRLGKISRVRGLPLRVETAGFEDLDGLATDPPAGVFLTQTPGSDLGRIVAFCRDLGIVLFSPFEGDIENGATAGIRVTDRILPYLNRKTVRASGLRFKPFFLQVAVIYE